MVDIAQLVSVPGCGPGGRGFESHYSPHNNNNLLLELYKAKIRLYISKFGAQTNCL